MYYHSHKFLNHYILHRHKIKEIIVIMTSEICKSHRSSIVRDMKNTKFNKISKFISSFSFFFAICYYSIKKNIPTKSLYKTESTGVIFSIKNMLQKNSLLKILYYCQEQYKNVLTSLLLRSREKWNHPIFY